MTKWDGGVNDEVMVDWEKREYIVIYELSVQC